MSRASLITIGLACLALTAAGLYLRINLPILVAIMLAIVVLARLARDYQDHTRR